MLIGNALELLPTLPARSYELVLAIDILEHFSKSDGAIFLRECKRVCRGSLLISTPKDFVPQEITANPLENHRSLWTEADLRGQGFTQFLPDALSWVGICKLGS